MMRIECFPDRIVERMAGHTDILPFLAARTGHGSTRTQIRRRTRVAGQGSYRWRTEPAPATTIVFLVPAAYAQDNADTLAKQLANPVAC